MYDVIRTHYSQELTYRVRVYMYSYKFRFSDWKNFTNKKQYFMGKNVKTENGRQEIVCRKKKQKKQIRKRIYKRRKKYLIGSWTQISSHHHIYIPFSTLGSRVYIIVYFRISINLESLKYDEYHVKFTSPRCFWIFSVNLNHSRRQFQFLSNKCLSFHGEEKY